jgi:hypothetical protein
MKQAIIFVSTFFQKAFILFSFKTNPEKDY